MKLRLKCIGGPCAGEFADVQDGQEIAVMFVPRRVEYAPAGPRHAAGKTYPSQQELYTRRRLDVIAGVRRPEAIEFLAPNGMSDYDALKTVLGP